MTSESDMDRTQEPRAEPTTEAGRNFMVEVDAAAYRGGGLTVAETLIRILEIEAEARSIPSSADPMLGTPADGRHPDHACGQSPCPHISIRSSAELDVERLVRAMVEADIWTLASLNWSDTAIAAALLSALASKETP